MEQSQQPPRLTEQEHEEDQDYKRVYKQCCDLVSSLQTFEGCSMLDLCFHSGVFLPKSLMVGSMIGQKLFQARPTDIIMATLPKSGTTWLKALLHATVNRTSSSLCRNLTTLNPHQCVPFLEVELYGDGVRVPDMDSMPSPRLLATHIPFHFLPNSIVESGCRVVYLCRNPKDNFVSLWHIISKIMKNNGREPLPLEFCFDHFCQGRSPAGPFWNHMLGYWKASLQQVEGNCNVLFMRYEELMKDPAAELKRLAEFVGCPFTQEEQANGVVKDIVEMCGFENLSNLEVNKVGKQTLLRTTFDNNIFFRQGVVGDWMNQLTPDMVQRIDKIIETKFEGSGLAP